MPDGLAGDEPVVVDQDLARLGVDGDGDGDGDLGAVGEVEHGRRRGTVPAGRARMLARVASSERLDDLVGEVLDVVEAVGCRSSCVETLGADLARGHLGVQVAGHVVGVAHVGEDEPPHVRRCARPAS